MADIQNGNRAEAWYEIRYNSDKEPPNLANGIAKRRYYESQTFGLFDTYNSPTLQEAAQAYQMLEAHRSTILDYEKKYGTDPNTFSPETAYQQIAAANSDYGLTGSNQVQTLTQAFDWAEVVLLPQLSDQHSILGNLDPTQYRSTNIYLDPTNTGIYPWNSVTLDARPSPGNSLLIGGVSSSIGLVADQTNDTLIANDYNDVLIAGAGNDTLYAGAGNDTLIGGAGNDQLFGGSGNDTFVIGNSGVVGTSGIETIVDPSGNGTVWIESSFGTTQLTGDTTDKPTVDLGQGTVTWTDSSTGLQYQFASDDGAAGLNLLSGLPASDTLNEATLGTLTINGGDISSSTVIIDNFNLSQAFSSNYLGVHFNDFGWLAQGAGIAQNPSGPVDPTPGALALTAYVAAASDQPQTVTVALTQGDTSRYAIDVDGTLTPLANGPVTLTIPAFMNAVSFGLVNTADVASPETVQLTETVQAADGNGGTTPVTYALNINYDATAFTDPVTTETIQPTPPSLDNSQPVNAGFTGDHQNDLIVGLNQGQAFTYDGQTYIANGDNYIAADSEVGDVGNDSISGGDGNDTIYVGPGNNIVAGNGGQDLIIDFDDSSSRIYADSPTDLASAVAQAETATPSGQKGDYITVNTGNNTIVGGTGDDFYNVGTGNNVIVFGAGNDTLTAGVNLSSFTSDWSVVTTSNGAGGAFTTTYNYITLSDSFVDTTNVTNYQGVGVGNDTIFGGRGNDVFWLSNGNNYLDAGSGDDSIVAGYGNNTIFGGQGNDVIWGVMGGHANDYIYGGSGNDLIVGESGDHTIIGGSGDDTIFAGNNGSSDWATSETGTNYIIGGSGNDLILGAGGNDTLIAGSGNSTLVGGAGDEYIVGGSGNDILVGGVGHDTLIAGGAGNDTLYAGTGATYIYGGDGSDVIYGGGGDDVIYAGDGGTAANPTQIFAGDGNTTVYGGNGTDAISGGAGTNVLYSGDGGTTANPTYVVAGSGNATLYGGNGAAVLDGRAGSSDLLVAGNGDNTLLGGGGADTLIAGAGNDYLIGGSGATYVFNLGGGNAEIAPSGSADNLQFGAGISAADLTLTAGFGSDGAPALVIDYGNGAVTVDGGLSGAVGAVQLADGSSLNLGTLLTLANVNATGVAGTNGDLIFDGNAGDVLTGGSGNDTIYGWGANDTLVAGSGNDAIYAEDANDSVTGGSGNDTLTGFGANETLDGGTGSTTFVINDATDVITQQANGNSNTVFSSVSYTQPENVQNLTLTGTADLTATGNDQGGTLTANSGNDTLIAGSGVDTLVGGAGNDTFMVNNTADVVTEQPDQGNNTVFSSVSYTQPENVQNLTLTGSSLAATGNDQAGTLTAQGANDTLIAGSGIDTLVGSGNDDTFIVNNTADVVTEQPNQGNNTVFSSVSYTQPENVQNLTLTGTADLTATGNDLDGVLTANSGNDTLIGGSGNQTLQGGSGLDTFALDYGMGVETVLDSSVQGAIVQLAPELDFSDLSAYQQGNDLELQISGTTSSVTLKNYFAAPGSWAFADATGNTETAQQLLDATATQSSDALAMMEAGFIAQTKTSIIDGLRAQGYILQSDGTWVLFPQFSPVTGSYTVTTTADAVTETYNNGAQNTTITSSSQSSWSDSSQINQYNNQYLTVEDASTTVNVVNTTTDDQIVNADPATTSQLAGQVVWLSVDWANGTPATFRQRDLLYEPIFGFPPIPPPGVPIPADGWFYDPQVGTATDVRTITTTETPVNGTVTGILPSPGNLRITGAYPEAVIADNQYTQTTDEIQQIDLGPGGSYASTGYDHDVVAGPWTLVNSSSGNDIINDAGFAYGGTGNDTMYGGGTLVAGSGDDWLLDGTTMIAGTGNDSLFGSGNYDVYNNYTYNAASSSTIVINADATGTDVIGDSNWIPDLVLAAFYNAQGISDWQDRYFHPNTYLYYTPDELDNVVLGPPRPHYVDAQDASAYAVDNLGLTLQQAQDQGLITYITPLPVLAVSSDSTALLSDYTARPAAYYATANIPEVTLATNDFSTLAPYYTSGALPIANKVKFGPGITPGALQLSWGQETAVDLYGNSQSSPYVTLNISWMPGQNLQVIMPHADDVMGSGVQEFDFADGSKLSLAQLIALAPPAPSFDPQLPAETFSFYTGMTQWVVGKTIGQIDFSQSPDLSASNVAVSHAGLDLVISANLNASSGPDVLRISNWFADPAAMPTAIATFADGTTLTSDQLTSLGLVQDYAQGNQTLTGLAGFPNVLIAGANDTLVSGSGEDTFVFSLGDGNGVITNESGNDTIRFGSGIAAANLALSRQANNLIIQYSASDQITVSNWFGGNQIGQIEFADGTVLTAADLSAQFNTPPVVSNPLANQSIDQYVALSLAVPANTFVDTDPGDSLTYAASLGDGSALPSWLTFDPVTRTFSGTPTHMDIGNLNVMVTATDQGGLSVSDNFALAVINTTPNDVIGTSANDVLDGTAGADYLSGLDGNDSINGNDGNDVLVGGAGYDTLNGGAGDDIFVITGTDTAYDVVNGGAGTDTVLGGSGDDTFRFNNFSGANTVEVIDGAGGTNIVAGTANNDVLDFSGTTLLNIAEIDGGAGNDSITGSAGNDVIIGGAGYDTLNGGAGDDTFVITGTDTAYDVVNGGDGSDTVLGGAGDDTFRFNNFSGANTVEVIDGAGGTNVVAGTANNDVLDFSGTTLLNIADIDAGAGNDSITGSAGNDVIIGGAGYDTLNGGAGDDTFLITGTDTAYDVVNGGAGSDTVLGGAGDDTFRFNNFSGANTVEVIDGAGGTNVVAGTANNDVLDFSGTTLLNIADIDGGAGNDSITGSAGNDVIIGGAGYDTLNGGAGDDTFLITGTDTAYDVVNGGAGSDTVLGGAGDDTFRFNNFSGANTVEVIDGAGGTNIVAGTANNDVLDFSGTTLLNIAEIDGGAGNDSITGSAGNDVIIGGAGYDTLNGGAGDDTFVITGTDTAYDVVNGGAGSDTVLGGAGDDTFRFNNFSGANTVEVIDGAGGTNVVAGTANNDVLDFSGTTLLNIADIDAGAGNDVVTGSAGNDVIIGGAGYDTLNGGAGDDTFVITGTDTAYDVVNGGAGSDTVLGGSGDDTFRFNNFSGANTVEVIDGAGGTNVVAGTANNDVLDFSGTTLLNIADIDAGAGNDVVTGSAGNDVIIGGAGDDTLNGGTGDDTYVFSPGSGSDTVVENDATPGNQDTLLFDAGTMPLDLVFSYSGNNLVISRHGSTDTVAVQNWSQGAAYQTEVIKTSDGSTLANTQVDQLIQAMASFSASHGGMTWNQAIDQDPTDVQVILAANWHPSS